MERYKPALKPKPNGKTGGDYFPSRSLEFIDSGCTLLNCILGGGWILGRPVNIVGDRSVGKTLCAIEACANFSRQYPTGNIEYREAEAAFDIPYAETVGLPAKKVNFGSEGIDTLWDTIDQIFDDSQRYVTQAKKSGKPGLYITDSLDALTSKEEKERDRSKGTYGTAKPKALSELFRVLVRDFRQTRTCYMVISQIRDKIGATFGAKYTRAGGKALDFYSNQTLYLSHLGTIVKTVGGIKRTTGVRIRAKCTKNKVGPSFGECEFILRYGYGIDDLMANVDWLEAVGRLNEIDVKKDQVAKFLAKSEKLEDDEYRALVKQASVVVTKAWQQVGADFKPRHSKYA
jgi:recombination protein RecA